MHCFGVGLRSHNSDMPGEDPWLQVGVKQTVTFGVGLGIELMMLEIGVAAHR